ncbi:hypothetical protein PR202_ga08005 [Eleusine coracana subsp. coracana]|uniref:VQ domain-containing protein n=1 Tax=Eleusine coracana subsp. coracana TaxID=191504 RepID=A0AAV5C083_ELECO|nr:hypothetical protein PR202_ga08005 [Eleusine coracana subsp. coracana]
MNNSNTAEDGHHQQGQNLQLQHRRRKQSSPGLKVARPYRRRIKPPPTKVHHVHPAGFRRFVRSRTCSQPEPDIDIAAVASAVAPAPVILQQPAPGDRLASSSSCAGGAVNGGDQQRGANAVCPISLSPRSMQEAYLLWCSSNDIPLSPGTMAELTSTMHRSSDAAAMASTSSTAPADHITGAAAGRSDEQY